MAKISTDRNEETGMVARMVEDTNKALRAATQLDDDTFGMCEWTDLDGNARCNSPWSRFQCEQAAGTFTPGASCDD